MGRWLVRLKGDKFDLEDLPALLHPPELAVIEENGSYYLQSSEFESLTSADEVRKHGIALIEIINGAVKLHRGDFCNVSEDGITRVEDNGKCHRYLFAEAGIFRMRGKATLTVTTPNGVERKIDRPTNIGTSINIAMKHEPVADTLHFFRERSWNNLYKVYEVIRDDVGGNHTIIKKGWVSKQELSRFTQTAQSRAVLGDDARHASERCRPPAQPMSLSEAESLIRGILMNWMQTKT